MVTSVGMSQSLIHQVSDLDRRKVTIHEVNHIESQSLIHQVSDSDEAIPFSLTLAAYFESQSLIHQVSDSDGKI